MPICNRFHGKLANNGKITTFMGYRSLKTSCTGFLEPRRLRLGPLKSKFNAENFICLDISVVNSLLKCVSQPQIAKKSTQKPILAFKVI